MSKDQHDTIKIEHGSHLEATDGSINGSTIRPSGDREKRFSPDGSGDLHGADGAPVVAMNIIENPLQRLNKEETVEAARQFCKDKGLEEHEELFARASLVSRDPLLFEDLAELLPEERAALIYEREHKWAGSKQLWYAILICALGAATQGWDQTGSNGANLSFPQEFGIGRTYGEAGGLRDEWIVGAVNSIIYLTAGLIGCWISDPLNHWFGRRGEIAITAVFLIATPIGSGFTQSWQQLFAVRFVMGIAIGAKNATVPIFSAEMAPARIRGGLVMFWQLWVCFGIFLGFAANVIVKDTGRIAWRLQLGSAFIPALPLLLGIYFCPESPRWLMKKGKYPKAFRSMKRLRKHEIIAARDLYYSHVLYEEEARVAKGATYFTRLWDCFRIPRIRRANYGATTVMLAQQFCGINIISFYSSTVFVEGGYTPTQALYASLGFGAVQLVFCAPAVFLVDTFGRRPLLLSTFPFMVLTLLATGLAFLMDEANAQARVALIATFIYLFSAFYSIGEGPCAFMYSAEVFPTIQREQGMAWAVAVNNTFAGILGLTFPPMRRAMTPTGAFGFYAGLNLVSLIMIFCLVPETKRLTLEELDQVFSVPTAQFIRHEWNEWLPWVFKRYVLRRKDLVKPPPIMETGDNLRRAASRHG